MKKIQFDERQKLSIINLYKNKISSTKIAKIFNCNYTTILRFLKENGIEVRPRTRCSSIKNESFFDKIDTEAKAYFLGLLMADGHNSIQRGRCHVSIALQERDVDILKKLSFLIYEKDKTKYCIKKTENGARRQNCYRLTIFSKHICEKLKGYGLVTNRIYNMVIPENSIPQELLRHFFRGYFDGNGCIFKTKDGQYGFSVISSIAFNKRQKEIIEKNINKNLYFEEVVKFKKQLKFPLTYLKNTGSLVTIAFLNYLYFESTLYIERKWKKYIELKEIVKNKYQFLSTVLSL